VPTLKSALRPAGGGVDLRSSMRRTSWAESLVLDEVFFERSVEMPPLDYKANLVALDRLRDARHAKGQPLIAFRELVAELDMAEGGEALSCLAQAQREETWGQLLTLGK